MFNALLVILFIAISYYPACAIVWGIEFVKESKKRIKEETDQEEI